ncbi:hypothetical protein H0H92_012826 [Tricholoma furcatifolium]|nr:hypothetical protein H0H92_012826 [Tricholoma furcatifolium]
MKHLLLAACSAVLLFCPTLVSSTITVYPTATTVTATATTGNYTGAAAYDPTILSPPPVPSGLNTAFTIQLETDTTANLSLVQNGSLIGFSVEMSVTNQVPFLNLMANIAERSGRVNIRVGGNTEDTATLVASTPDGKMLEKNITGESNPTDTPPLLYTPDLLYMMANISELVNIYWFVGVPFLINDTETRLAIAQAAYDILGDKLMGLQIANEPDLYQAHGHYTSYQPTDYYNDFGTYVQDMENANLPGTNLLVGPNIAYADWTTEDVWNTGFVSTYQDNLAFLSVENYPTDNCAAEFNTGGTIQVPQDIFIDYLTHTGQYSGNNIIQKFLNSTQFAIQYGKRLIMMETNTASCGGFPGISDSFGAALWGIDYAFQLAYNNFGMGMLHVSGQDVYYNPFTPPPTNESSYHQWTVGPTYYSALISAESLGPSNNTQIIDLGANSGSEYTPAYAFFENGNPVRVGIINYVTDPTGASDLEVSISIGGSAVGQSNATPSSVQVKYLLSSSVSDHANFTWAGQTFGDVFSSDGRPVGDLNVTTIQCDTTNNVCVIPVPAPAYALVFLSSSAMDEPGAAASTTFATSLQTKTVNTITVNQAVLETSNGGYGKQLGSTSPGSASGSIASRVAPGVMSLFALAAGLLLIGRVAAR